MRRKDWQGTERTLVHTNGTRIGEPAEAGETLTDFRGDVAILRDARAPHKSGSTGRVYVDEGGEWTGEYFPSVYGLEWREA